MIFGNITEVLINVLSCLQIQIKSCPPTPCTQKATECIPRVWKAVLSPYHLNLVTLFDVRRSTAPHVALDIYRIYTKREIFVLYSQPL